MTNAARKLDASDAAGRPLDWSMLVPSDEAAKKLDVTDRRMRQRAAKELADRGMAIYTRHPSGGPMRWFIDRRVDNRLAPGIIGEQYQKQDLSRYPRKKVDKALMQARCVDLFRAACSTKPGNQADWIDDFVAKLAARFQKIRISKRSLMRWRATYQTPADIIKLIDSRGGDQKSQGDPKAWAYFRSIFLDDRPPSIKICWERTKAFAQAESLTWCSYTSCRRQLNDRIDLEIQVRHRDPKRWRSQFAPYHEQDPERFAAGECWAADHRPLDLLCRIGKRMFRPYITVWQDWRTRKIVGWDMCETPNSTTILAAFRTAILDPSNMGGPAVIWIDNGKDFDAWTFHGQTKQQRRKRGKVEFDEPVYEGLFGRMDIEAHWAIPRGPQGKPRVERVFATVAGRFDISFGTYTSKDTVRKPEQLKDVVKNLRNVPTLEHVRERFGEWVKGYNAKSDHSIDDMVDADGQRLSPNEAMARWCPVLRRMADPGALDLLLKIHHKPVNVGRNGVRIMIAGKAIRYGQYEQALGRFKGTGKKVHVSYDPNDIRTVLIYDEQWQFICEASMNSTGGRHNDPISQADASTLHRRKAAHNRRVNEMRKNRDLEYITDEELMAREAEKRRPTEPTADPVNLKIVRTPVDGQSEAIQRETHRKAAGAETYQFDDDDDLGSIGSLAKLGGMAGSDDGDDDDDELLDLGSSATFADADGDDMDTDVLDLRSEDQPNTEAADDPHILDDLT